MSESDGGVYYLLILLYFIICIIKLEMAWQREENSSFQLNHFGSHRF